MQRKKPPEEPERSLEDAEEWILIELVVEKTGVTGKGSTTPWADREPGPWWASLKRRRRVLRASNPYAHGNSWHCPHRHSEQEFLEEPSPATSIITRGNPAPPLCCQSQHRPRGSTNQASFTPDGMRLADQLMV